MAIKEKTAKKCKEKMVEELLEKFRKHPDFILTNYMGSSVSDLETLRRDLKKSKAGNYFVVKNSILKVIFDKLKVTECSAKIDAGMGIALSGEDVITTCKILTSFARTHDKLKIKSAVIDGRPVTLDKIKHLSSIPSKDALIAQVIGGIKSPITGFVNTLGAILRKFVYVVDAIKTSKQNTGA